jgi:hypothetical protein
VKSGWNDAGAWLAQRGPWPRRLGSSSYLMIDRNVPPPPATAPYMTTILISTGLSQQTNLEMLEYSFSGRKKMSGIVRYLKDDVLCVRKYEAESELSTERQRDREFCVIHDEQIYDDDHDQSEGEGNQACFGVIGVIS